ncbi:hypothetical protein VB779_16760 [Haloarculaceae archaeon H-GB11]|nr:hypothetical protein [Haloarculaceae archaeon H-GB11]
MADPRNATQELIEDRPEFESKLRLLLEIDTRRAVWDFDDIPWTRVSSAKSSHTGSFKRTTLGTNSLILIRYARPSMATVRKRELPNAG